MSKSTAAVQPTVTLRWMMQRDLPHVLQITQQAPAGRWTQQDFLSVFQSADAAGWVAEIDDHVVGFLIYTVTWQVDGGDDGEDDRTTKRKNDQAVRPLRIVLLNLAVSLDWRRRGIASALLERLAQKLRQLDDCIQVTVPETNLAVQLLLREAGFKATRVMRGYYNGEDGYLMERRRA